MHLARDVAIAYNAGRRLRDEMEKIEAQKPTWHKAKEERAELARKLSEMKYHMRMCLIGCFNLAEAYINGIAWEHIATCGVLNLSENQRKLLEGIKGSILERLVKIPGIVMKNGMSPLCEDQPPLSEFRDIIKPYRDSIVHASPFSAPERFGGYDKLARIYELDWDTVKHAVSLTFDIILRIHCFVRKCDSRPEWLPSFDETSHIKLVE